jgi:hypothetical protein
MKYAVNDTTITYEAAGETQWGPNTVLLNESSDLTATSWRQPGYAIEPLLDTARYTFFKKGIHELLFRCWRSAGLTLPDDLSLEQYHVVARTQQEHLAAVEKTKLLSVNDLPLPISEIEERISAICGVPLRTRNPYDDQSVFHFRVIRPNSADNNPLHRDVWLEDYAACINLYIPVAGSNARSSLILLPGSHYWPESRVEKTVSGAVIGNVRFNVPAVTAIEGAYTVVRPDPKENEVLVFSPYMIHGGAVNLNANETRISIEMRLWKKE